MVIEKLVAWQDVMSRIEQKMLGDYIDGFAIEYISPLTGKLVELATNCPSSRLEQELLAEILPATFPPAHGYELRESYIVALDEETRRIMKVRALIDPPC